MEVLDKVGVSRKAAKCWFKLNQNNRIKVKTAAGMLAAAEAGDLVGQGTAGAGLVSQLNLDMGLQHYLAGSDEEIYYGGVRVEYTAFQDDVGKPSRGVREAQAHMTKLAYMFEDKGLEAHLEKTCYILMKGNKKDVNKTEVELKMNPIVFGSFVMDRKTNTLARSSMRTDWPIVWTQPWLVGPVSSRAPCSRSGPSSRSFPCKPWEG